MDEKDKEGQEDASKKKKVGNYLLGKMIGQGSFSKVRLGLHIIAREKVVVKIVPKKVVLLRDFVKRSVRREAMLLQKVDHPNIVRLYEIMETTNSYYLVLEYAEAGDFIKYLSRKKKLDERECRRFIRQMASAVDHMHLSNITHRDLKLENILLDKDHNIKLIDFGLSNVFYGESSLNAQCGSPMYAAPEIFCNAKYGPGADIWSMGICLYAMLTGRLPFVPEPPNNLTMLHTLVLRGATLPDNISNCCAHLLSRMLTVDMYSRITMEELLEHSWLLEGHQTPLVTRQPPLGKLYPIVPKTEIVNYMTTLFNFIEDDIYYSVIERKMNAVAATYQLLQRRFDAGLQLVGFPINGTNESDIQTAGKEVMKGRSIKKVEFPMLPPENGGEQTSGEPRTKLKSYTQLLKDSAKSRSTQNTRSGSILRQKEIILRRYKTKVDMNKQTQAREDTGFMPDFILTYNPPQNTIGNLPSSLVESKQMSKFEWEQTFVISKDTTTLDRSSLDPQGNRSPTRSGQEYSIQVQNTAENVIPAPPTTPASPTHLPEVVTASLISPRAEDNSPKPSMTKSDKDKSVTEDTSASDPASVFQKQKTHLARVVTSLDRNRNHVSFQYALPLTKPKTLTTREARSYFEEFEKTKVIGQGRTLIERSKTSSSSAKREELHDLWDRKARTAGPHREFPDFRYTGSRSAAHRQVPGSDVQFRSLDPSRILHFPDVTHTSLPVYGIGHEGSETYSVEDGVTDVIKVHITSSAKF